MYCLYQNNLLWQWIDVLENLTNVLNFVCYGFDFDWGLNLEFEWLLCIINPLQAQKEKETWVLQV